MNRLDEKTARKVAEALHTYTWEAPLSSYLDPKDVLHFLEHISTHSNWSDILTDWLSEFEGRHPAEDEIWSEPLKTLLHNEAYDAIEAALSKGEPIDEALLQELMGIELVSIILRRLVEKILEAFVERVINRDNPKIASVSRSAFGLAARASKGLFERVSAQIEGPLRQTMQGFVQGSMDRIKDQLADILRSDEVRDKLGDAKQTLYRYHTQKTFGDLREKLGNDADESMLVKRLAQAVQHLAGHSLLRSIIETEVNGLLSKYGDRSISTLIPEQTRQQLDDQLGERLIAHWTQFFQSDAFEAAIKN